VSRRARQHYAFEGRTLFSVSIEGIGKTPEISIMRGKEKTASETIPAESYKHAAANFLPLWERKADSNSLPQLSSIDAIAIRVVHRARDFEDRH
jgi:acetate kinase